MLYPNPDPRLFSADLARRARALGKGQDVLFHGTPYPSSILSAGVIRYSKIGDQAVCLTRCPEEASYWASLERDDDEGRGAILVLDRASLRSCLRVEPHQDFTWGYEGSRDETEERIWFRDVQLGPHLLGFVAEARPYRSKEQRERAWQRSLEIASAA